MKRRLWAIAYDIADPRRLQRVAHASESFGIRVQESIFEAALSPWEREQCIQTLRELCLMREDSLKLYPVCEACRHRIEWQGKGEAPGGARYWVV